MLIITLVASEEIQTTPMVGFGVVTGLGGLISGIIYASFNSYTHTKSTRIECLFNMDFKHIMGEIPKNDFNKIDDFKITNVFENSKLQTVFKYDDNFIFGALDKDTSVYKLYKLD
ncbi:MAG: hypothetical protein QNK89_00855 [Lacinutrix sp.]|uniref:hypothetical protein n=1 Tax=Lacinutrix sp. TaxID=1937692 RepID=UPI00309A9D48